MNASPSAVHRRRVGFAIGATLVLLTIVVAWERRWLSCEPTYHSRTVTEWLDSLALYEHQKRPNATWIVPRPPQAIAQDPAYHALLKIGSNGLPVLIATLRRPAEWPPDISAFKRGKMWVEWRWHQLLGARLSRPAPREWSETQTARKTAAGFALVGLGTNAGGGFPKYVDVYASAPRHQTIYGTQVAGPPIGVSSLDVVRSAIAVIPERREEVIGEVLRTLDHTNALHRSVALECTHAFREELLQKRKDRLVSLAHDEDPTVQEAALGNLLLIVQNKALTDLMSPAEIARISQTILDDPGTSPRVRQIAKTLLRLAINSKPAILPVE